MEAIASVLKGGFLDVARFIGQAGGKSTRKNNRKDKRASRKDRKEKKSSSRKNNSLFG
jgi:hypothetical protein